MVEGVGKRLGLNEDEKGMKMRGIVESVEKE